MRFSRYLREEERSEATVEKYLRETRRFYAWMDGREVTKITVTLWKEHLIERGYSPSTVNGKLTALDRLLRFLGWEECCTKHLKQQRKLFRDDSRELTKQEYEQLLAIAEKTGRERLHLLMEAI